MVNILLQRWAMADEDKNENYLSGHFKLSGDQLKDKWKDVKALSRILLWLVVTILGVDKFQPFLPTRANVTLEKMVVVSMEQGAQIQSQQKELDGYKKELNEVRQEQINCLTEQKSLTRSQREQKRIDEKIESIKAKLGKPIGQNQDAVSGGTSLGRDY